MAHTQSFGARQSAFTGRRPFFQHGLQRSWAYITDAMARRRVYLRTLRELESLSPRELSEIGIAHYQITRIAQETAYGY